ncbi:MAG: ABC transporter substrate-binding protein [Nevskia sp.]
MLKKLFSLVLAFGFTAGALADAQPPEQAIRATTEQLQGLIKTHYKEYRADSAKFFKIVDEVVVPRFDVPFIAKLVLATNYRTATETQRTRFATAFKDMLVHSYANALLDNYDSVKVDWQPARLAAGASDATVNTVLTRDVGKPYAIGFRVHLVDNDWKIYDIAVENISLVTNFRTQLNAEIKKTGLDAVIARMESGDFVKDADGKGKKS